MFSENHKSKFNFLSIIVTSVKGKVPHSQQHILLAIGTMTVRQSLSRSWYMKVKPNPFLWLPKPFYCWVDSDSFPVILWSNQRSNHDLQCNRLMPQPFELSHLSIAFFNCTKSEKKKSLKLWFFIKCMQTYGLLTKGWREQSSPQRSRNSSSSLSLGPLFSVWGLLLLESWREPCCC